MEAARRGYKLQEFVAHASDVNCLSIGKRSCRVFVTGGVDRKVNLWAIGQPTALLSLSGHTSSVESVTFDSAEVLMLAGAYSGAIKLWDLEEAKLVRTLTGHRASCTSVEFHPFGEFFASGSLDNDLKIWDIRRKGCIHTYQGHNGAIKTVKFTPDGRWVVSGGEDNVVKLWDLTAGKLLHEFKFHTGPIQSIDFHPNEFLLATGSADRTVKFWDLETFELIGSAGPEMTGVRSMIFHPDGKTLFCGLDESLKVFSWEPIRCHDIVGMRWSILGDLSIFDGKLLGCSYHQSSVGVWVADISLVVPYAVGVVPRASGLSEPTYKPSGSPTHHHSTFDSKMTSVNKLQDSGSEMEETIKSVYVASSDNIEGASSGIHSMGTSSINQSSPGLAGENHITSNSCGKALQSYDVSFASKVSSPASKSLREAKTIESYSGTPRRIDSSFPPRRMSSNSTTFSVRSSPISISKDSREAQRGNKTRGVKSSVSMPVLMPRDGPCLRNSDTARKEIPEEVDITGCISFNRRHMSRPSSSDGIGYQKDVKESVTLCATTDRIDSSFHSMSLSDADTVTNENSKGTISLADKHDRISSPVQPLVADSGKCIESVRSSPEKGPVKYVKGVAVQHGRTKSLVESWERFNGSSATSMRSSLNMMAESDDVSSTEILVQSSENGLRLDGDGCNDLLQTHDSLINALKSRLKKLQMVRHMWAESSMNGAITAVSKLPDHSVQVDVITILMEKVELFTLDLFSSMLPLLAGLLSSKIERHTDVSLEMLLKLVRVFGPVIRSTVCASRPVGIDIQAEQRRERCQLCLNGLEKIKQCLPLLIRKGGSIAKRALELNLALDE